MYKAFDKLNRMKEGLFNTLVRLVIWTAYMRVEIGIAYARA